MHEDIRRCLATVLVFLSVCSADAVGQSIRHASIEGAVTDASGAAVPDAAITIVGPNHEGVVRTTRADGRGVYRIVGLPPGSYGVTADHPGFAQTVRSGIGAGPGSTVTVDLRLEPAHVEAVVDVSPAAPALDVSNPATETHIGERLLQNLPTSRAIAEVVNLAPGVAGEVAFGGTQRNNGLVVEGIDVREGLYQEAFTRLNYNWIESVQIAGLGAGVEHGPSTGVMVHATMRSGSNRWSGLGEYLTTRPGWLSDNTRGPQVSLPDDFVPRTLLGEYDVSAQIGGPMQRNRWWFFTGLQVTRSEDRDAGTRTPGSTDARERRALFRITGQATPSLRVDGLIENGLLRVTGDGLSRNVPLEAARLIRQPETHWNGRLTWVPNASTVLEVRHGGFASDSTADPMPPATRAGPAGHFDLSTGLSSVSAYPYTTLQRSRQSTSATLTHFADALLGRRHEFRLGVEVERSLARNNFGWVAGLLYLDMNGAPDTAVFWDGSIQTGRSQIVTAYAQDGWQVAPRVTVTAGVRVVANRGSVPQKGTVFSTTPVAPRIGVAWHVPGAGSTVVRGHYGRYHDPLFSHRFIGEDRSWQNPQIEMAILPSGELVEQRRGDSPNNFSVDRGIRHSYVDQYVVGVERAFAGGLSLRAHHIWRHFEDFMGLVDTGLTWSPAQAQDPGPDGRLNTPDDGALLDVFRRSGSSQFLYTNPEQAYRRYRAFQVVATGRGSAAWDAQASYTWSINEGTVTNRASANAGNWDLGSPGSFVNPNLFINALGRSPFDFTHEFKLLGTSRVAVAGGFQLSGVYRYHTGAAWGRVALVQIPGHGGQRVRIEPRGTRRTPSHNVLDVRIEKTMALGHRGPRLGLFVDAFNLLNTGAIDSEGWSILTDLGGSSFGEPLDWLDPRTLRVGLRVVF